MAKRRRKVGVDFDELVDGAVDSAVGAVFERAETLFERVRSGQVKSLSAGAMRDVYTCAACRRGYRVDDMEMVNPSNEFGVCRNCFRFMWSAAREKLASFAKRKHRQQESGAGPAASGPRTVRRPPWEVLGIAQDATVDEIKKAYRKLALEWHPDRVPAEERDDARLMFEEITRAKEVMVKVRSAPEG